MWLAVNAPERVERLALCCTAPAFAPRQGWIDRAAAVRADGVGAIANAVLGRWFRPSFHDAHPDVVAHFRAMLVATPREGYAACCDALADVDLTPRLGEIGAPTLVVTGADDPVVTPADGDALAAAIPDAVHAVDRRALRTSRTSSNRDAFTEALLRHLGEERGGTNEHRRDGTSIHARGMEVRRAVLGDAHVDGAIERTTPFTEDFQDLITRYAWGEIWSRPGLDRRTRSCITLTALIALGHQHELAMHVRAALRNGLTPDEIGEVILQSAIYCGVPANSAFAIAKVLEEGGAFRASRVRRRSAYGSGSVGSSTSPFVGAGPDASFVHGRSHGVTEAMLAESRLPCSAVRNGMYGDEIASWFDADGRITGSGGDGRISFSYRPELGEAIATLLAEPGHDDRDIVTITTPDAVSLAELAALATDVTRRLVPLRAARARGVDRLPPLGSGAPSGRSRRESRSTTASPAARPTS